MARRTNADKGKESLALLGVKIDPSLKKAIGDEGDALGIPMSTYARQLLITGWQSRHETSIAKNPREVILAALFNDLPLSEQDNVIAMVEALHKRHARESEPDQPIPTERVSDRIKKHLRPGEPINSVVAKKGGK